MRITIWIQELFKGIYATEKSCLSKCKSDSAALAEVCGHRMLLVSKSTQRWTAWRSWCDWCHSVSDWLQTDEHYPTGHRCMLSTSSRPRCTTLWHVLRSCYSSPKCLELAVQLHDTRSANRLASTDDGRCMLVSILQHTTYHIQINGSHT